MIVSLRIDASHPTDLQLLELCLADLGLTYEAVVTGPTGWDGRSYTSGGTPSLAESPWDGEPLFGVAELMSAGAPASVGLLVKARKASPLDSTSTTSSVDKPSTADLHDRPPPAQSDDEGITESVWESLLASGRPEFRTLRVAALDGIVVLRGELPSELLRQEARLRAVATPGVSGLWTDLAVPPS